MTYTHENIGPNELAIFHPDAIELVEGFATKCWRPDYDDIISPDFSLAFERNKQLHDARRNVWSRATGSKGMYITISTNDPRCIP